MVTIELDNPLMTVLVLCSSPESQSSTVSLPTSGTFGSEEVESVCARTRSDYPELTVEICDRGGISCKAEVIRG